ncbi:MAG: tyrosine-protein phosphatase [Sphingomonadaceae bacterium]|nr:tyrosine-protein phosphatase [Sphingomonadaceae bacterium]
MTNDRLLPLEGIHNFRDYGGYATAGGGRVRRGVLWRSGQHHEASDADLAVVAEIDLAHVVDLRGSSERNGFPCRRPAGFAAQVVFYDGETTNRAPHEEAEQGTPTADQAHMRMVQLYRRMPYNPPMLAIFRDYFAALAEGKGPSLVHCFAGKDRTGVAVALLHHSLGVHPDDAMADYLLTNLANETSDVLARQSARLFANRPGNATGDALKVLLGTDEAFLHAAFERIADEHGSLDAYLEDMLGVDSARREALRNALLV